MAKGILAEKPAATVWQQPKGEGMELGRTYKDKITGLKGIATGFVQYLSGCNQALIAPPAKEDGTLPDCHWFDVQRLEPQPGDKIILDNEETPGADVSAPKR